MAPTRRTVLVAAGTAAAASLAMTSGSATAAESGPFPARTGATNPVVAENSRPGSGEWCPGHDETCGVDLRRPQIQGYATTASVAPGERLGLHLSSRTSRTCTVEIYRLGHYAGVRARRLLTARDVPTGGRVSTARPTWSVTVPREWTSGVFLAVLTAADGHRAYAPFVVREPARRSDVLALVRLTTDHAPVPGLGLPEPFGEDTTGSRWLEEAGYDVTYATDEDVRAGRVHPASYPAVVLFGADGRARAPHGALARTVALPRPLALTAPGPTDPAARRAAAEQLDRLVSGM